MKDKNIVPVFDIMAARTEKEKHLKQHAKCFWFTGLPGSGKTTLAVALENELLKRGFTTILLDGDNLRSGLNAGLGFSDSDRRENIRRVAEVNKILLASGIISLNSFVSPTNDIRGHAEEIIGSNDFNLIWVSAPSETCEKRDVKKHYSKARKGSIGTFTGISAPFENPAKYSLEIPTHRISISESLDLLLKHVLPLIEINK